MARQRKHPEDGSAGGHPEPDGLSALLDTERDLTSVLNQADEEAAGILEATRARIQERDQAAEARLAADLAALDTREEATTATALSTAAAEAKARAVRLDAVAEERVRALADAVLNDFLGVTPVAGDA